jgi:hypothetical protein
MLLAPAVPPVVTMPLLSTLPLRPLVPIAGKIRLTQYRMVAVQSLKDSYAIDFKYLIPKTNKSQSVSLVVKQQ